MNVMSNPFIFRPDIEGLRAVAVLSVLAFHHQWGGFSGGYVGVDVFFVISGYLITRNILCELQREGKFSFKNFYIRRARRLFPALFATVAITLLVGIFLASPSDLKHIAQSSIASILSVSNVYFWGQSGYFDSAANQKPLLHTWSLAVEEQFYLVWPVLVVLLARYVKSQRAAVLSLSVIGIIGIWAAERGMEADAEGVFFLTPYRISEFALGALCAWVPSRSHKRQIVGKVVSVVALGLIGYPVFNYTDTTVFPGLSALLPCVGAAMLILFNGADGVLRWVLTNPVATGIGRISYSLYLAHWPIYVFYRQWKGSALDIQETLLVSLATLAFAVIMYKFVEQPFRSRGSSDTVTIPTQKFVKIFSALTVGLIAVSAGIWTGEGWPWRYSADLTRLTQESDTERKERFKPYLKYCQAKSVQSCDVPTEGINVFILGDSHAADIFNALVEQYPKFHYVFNGLGGCPPLAQEDFTLLTVKHPNRDACIARNIKLLYDNQLAKADIVIINTVFEWYKPEHLAHTVMQIHKTTNAPIVVLGNYLFFDDDLPDLVVKHGVTRMDDYYEERLSGNTFAYENELESLSKTRGFTYISKKKLFCESDSVMSCPIMFDGKLFTYDRHHLSLAAAKTLGYELSKSNGDIFKQLEKQLIVE